MKYVVVMIGGPSDVSALAPCDSREDLQAALNLLHAQKHLAWAVFEYKTPGFFEKKSIRFHLDGRTILKIE